MKGARRDGQARKGEKLDRGQSLTSRNGAYTLTLQDDGNLVLAARVTPCGRRAPTARTPSPRCRRTATSCSTRRTSRSGTPIPGREGCAADPAGRPQRGLRIRRRRMGFGHEHRRGATTSLRSRRPHRPRLRPPRPKSRCRPPRLRHRRRRRRLRHHRLRRRAPTQWYPVTRCGQSRSASTATAASTSGSPTRVDQQSRPDSSRAGADDSLAEVTAAARANSPGLPCCAPRR